MVSSGLRRIQSQLAQETLRPNTLQNLGNERAAAAKRELVTAIGIDAARVSISFQRDLQTAGVQMAVES